MPKFLLEVRYTSEGLQGLVDKGGTVRTVPLLTPEEVDRGTQDQGPLPPSRSLTAS